MKKIRNVILVCLLLGMVSILILSFLKKDVMMQLEASLDYDVEGHYMKLVISNLSEEDTIEVKDLNVTYELSHLMTDFTSKGAVTLERALEPLCSESLQVALGKMPSGRFDLLVEAGGGEVTYNSEVEIQPHLRDQMTYSQYKMMDSVVTGLEDNFIAMYQAVCIANLEKFKVFYAEPSFHKLIATIFKDMSTNLGDSFEIQVVMESYETLELTNLDEFLDKEYGLEKLNGRYAKDLVLEGIEEGVVMFPMTDLKAENPREATWYQEAKNARDGILYPPYLLEDSKNILMTYIHPIYDGDHFVGGIKLTFDLNKLREMMTALEVRESSRILVADDHGLLLYNSDTQALDLKELGLDHIEESGFHTVYFESELRDLHYSINEELGWQTFIFMTN